MIQPARTLKTLWVLEWTDIEEPFFSDGRWMLPAVVSVFRQGGSPLLGQELLDELDQRRAERLICRLIADNGAPDRLYIAGADEWDEDGWEALGRDFGFTVSFYEEEDVRLPKAVLDARAARDNAANILRQHLAAQFPAASPAQKAALAAGLAETAATIRSPRKRRAMLERALDFDKNSVPALVALGETELSASDPDAALKLLARIPGLSSPLPSHITDPWEDPEARALLRGLYTQAMALWHKGSLADALATLETLLQRNPADHQGARFHIPLLMQLNDLHPEAARWFTFYQSRYPGDFHDPGLQFSWGLSLSIEEREDEAFHRYRQGILRNLYIAPQILDLPEPPSDFWHPNERSEPAYADEFCRSFGALWEREASARRFLAECHDRLQHEIQTLISIRRRLTALQDQRYDPDHEAKWNALMAEEKNLLEAAPPAS